MRTRVKPAFCHSASSFLILALAAADDRGEQVEAGAFGQRHDPVDHLADGLGGDGEAGGGAVGHSDARPEQAHVIVDLGDGGDGRARVALDVVFCSIEMAGERPSIWSTSGFCIISRNWRA